ncbi:hypothetical protein [Thalassotalea eurytherma]|uniref:hypothetical protein n=1 Tax=Thalassotalea eurytherma TaxID=1144278 RepID=UPI0024E1831E|nr:hypothetical protein [Thalassotalea eurytherma]
MAQWQENETKEHVFGRCVNALYQAKDDGRNRVESRSLTSTRYLPTEYIFAS